MVESLDSDRCPPPEWAPRVWMDKRNNVFIMFRDGSVLRIDATEGALGKALKVFPKVEDQPGYVSGRQNIVDHVLKKPIKVAKTTERQRLVKSMSPERKSMIRNLPSFSKVKEKESK